MVVTSARISAASCQAACMAGCGSPPRLPATSSGRGCGPFSDWKSSASAKPAADPLQTPADSVTTTAALVTLSSLFVTLFRYISGYPSSANRQRIFYLPVFCFLSPGFLNSYDFRISKVACVNRKLLLEALSDKGLTGA